MSGSRVLRSTYLRSSKKEEGDGSAGFTTTMKSPSDAPASLSTRKRTSSTAFANTKQFSAKAAATAASRRRASLDGPGGRPASAPVTRSKSGKEEPRGHINVYVRVRPLSEKEKAAKSLSSVEVVGGKDVYLHEFCGELDYLRQKRIKARRFTFDTVFGETSLQEDVYQAAAAPLVESVVEAKNACCFCYGATGAGKTHTMLGTTSLPGVMVLALRDLFRRLESQSSEFEVRLSYLEIYNEQVKDLLTPGGKPLDLREDPVKGVTAAKLTDFVAKDAAEVMGLLQKGNKRRTTEPTRANQVSSRSHAILQVMVEMRTAGEMRHGKLSLIDLAGSERALATDSRTARSLEGANINKSLLSLSSCISALVAGKKHIPFRNSKLTQLLKDSLGGACLTSMVANISPAHLSLGENQNTLHWADRAKMIRSDPVANSSVSLLPPAPPPIPEAAAEEEEDDEEEMGYGGEGAGGGGAGTGRGGMKRLTRAAAKAMQSPGAVPGRPSRAELRHRMDQLDTMVRGMEEGGDAAAPRAKVRRTAGAQTAREAGSSRRMTVANDGIMEGEMKVLREQLKALQQHQQAAAEEARAWKEKYESDKRRQEARIATLDSALRQKDEILLQALSATNPAAAVLLSPAAVPPHGGGGGSSLSARPGGHHHRAAIAPAPAPPVSLGEDEDMANLASPTLCQDAHPPSSAGRGDGMEVEMGREEEEGLDGDSTTPPPVPGCGPGAGAAGGMLGSAFGRIGSALGAQARWQTPQGLSDLLSSVAALTPGRHRAPATAAAAPAAPAAEPAPGAPPVRAPLGDSTNRTSANQVLSPGKQVTGMRRPSARFDLSEIRALGIGI